MALSDVLSAELTATCNALGFLNPNDQIYYKDSNTLETVKDLIRYLRRDDEGHAIRRQLGDIKVLKTDLLPLMVHHSKEQELFDVVLRLLVNLTTPALVLWNEEIPVDATSRHLFMEVDEYLQDYKQAFTTESVWKVMSDRMGSILRMASDSRGSELELIMERMLVLIRNIMYVQPDDVNAGRCLDRDASIHDQVIWAMHEAGIIDVLLYMSNAAQEHRYHLHVLEIVHFMMRDQSGKELARATLERSRSERMRDESELLAIRRAEQQQKAAKTLKYTAARHSRFGGTYVLPQLKAINPNNSLIYHKPLNQIDDLDFDRGKQRKKKPANRRPMGECEPDQRKSPLAVRLLLKQFCVEFLNGAYNVLMKQVCQVLMRDTNTLNAAPDCSYYLWCMRFFMEFNRYHGFDVKYVSETVSMSTFHFVQKQSDTCFDLIQNNRGIKRQAREVARVWAGRLHMAIKAYRELLLNLMAMDAQSADAVRHSSRVLKSNLFYVPEHRDMVLQLLLQYDEIIMTHAYLLDVIHTQHIFVRLLESFCRGSSGASASSVVVQKRRQRRQQQQRRKQTAKPSNEGESHPMELSTEEAWSEVAQQLALIVAETDAQLPDMIPFDAASDIPIDEQKVTCMRTIHHLLRNNKAAEALSMLRAAREVWPEDGCFGELYMSTDEDIEALKDIFHAKIAVDGSTKQSISSNQLEPTTAENDDWEDEEEEEVGHHQVDFTETEFNFEEFGKRLAHPKIVRACALALRTFQRNTPEINHCIAKLLHRIAYDNKMYVMLCQVSLFITFGRVEEQHAVDGRYKELVELGKFVLRKFIRVSQNNPLIFMEALFWKNSRDCYEIEHGYGTMHGASVGKRGLWLEQEEDDLKFMFMEEQQQHTDNIKAIIDAIEKRLPNRSRRAIIKKLKELYLLASAPIQRQQPQQRRSQWTEEQELELRELFERYRDDADPMACVMQQLVDPQRSKRSIVDKLLAMGVISDRKEVRKRKKSRRSQAAVTHSGDEQADARSSDESDDDDEDDDDGLEIVQRSTPDVAVARSQSRKRPITAIQFNRNDVIGCLKPIVESNLFGGALEWLRDSFQEALDDLNEADIDDIPLVPFTEDAVNGMENTIFQTFLRHLGMSEPADEQEIYWRIPVYGNVQDRLQNYIEVLDTAIKGEINWNEITQNPIDVVISSQESESEEGRPIERDSNTHANTLTEEVLSLATGQQDDGDNSGSDMEMNVVKRRRILESSSEDET